MTDMAYAIEAGEALPDALRRVVAEQVQHVLALRGDGEVETRVHELRKRIKQLRALLRLVRPEIGDAFGAFNARLRDIAQRLSGIRDAHVLVAVVDKLSNGAHEAERDALLIVRRSLSASEPGGIEAAITGAIEDIRGLQPVLASAVWPLEDRFRVIGRGLQRTYRDGRRAMHNAIESPRPVNMHQWRKRAKDHWHQLQLLRHVAPDEFHERAARAKELSDVLGDDHDLALLYERIAADASLTDETRDAVLRLTIAAQQRLQQRARELGEALYDRKPRAFRKHVRKRWRAWRG